MLIQGSRAGSAQGHDRWALGAARSRSHDLRRPELDGIQVLGWEAARSQSKGSGSDVLCEEGKGVLGP